MGIQPRRQALEESRNVSIIRETVTVKEGRGNLDDGSSLVDYVVDNLTDLASIGIDEGSNLRFGINHITNVEGEAPSNVRKPIERYTKQRRSIEGNSLS